MGISDTYHFEWHREIADDIASRLHQLGPIDALCLAERGRPHMLDALAPLPVKSETFFDVENPNTANAIRGDLNDMSAIEFGSANLVTLFRASMFIEDKHKFLASLKCVLRPGGVALIDWLHGYSDAPVIDFMGGGPVYAGEQRKFRCTYLDTTFLTEHPAPFQALLAHVNRPPKSGVLGAFFAKRVNTLTIANYSVRLRAALAARDYELIDEADLARHELKVIYRAARYFHRKVGKFNCYIFTAIERS
jgi:SAM-dependent methyltransferase